MSIYSRYLLAQIARPMITTILVALIALLAERTLRVIDLVVGWRGSLLVVFEMLGYLIPHYMGLALPVAFFLVDPVSMLDEHPATVLPSMAAKPPASSVRRESSMVLPS